MTDAKKGSAAEVATDGMDWEQESSGGDLYKWEKVGQKVAGLLTARREVQTQTGAMTVYDILTKDGDLPVPGTKGLNDLMKRYPADSSVLVEIEFTEEKKSRFKNPFKVFKVRAAQSNEQRLKALGITVFGASAETTTEHEEG